jgi:solute carrier family 35, member F1/2
MVTTGETNQFDNGESLEESSRGNGEDSENDPSAAPVKKNILAHAKILLFGQFISVVMATLWSTQSTLFLHCSLSVPSFSNSWVFLILSLNLIPLYLEGKRIKTDSGLADPPYWFMGGRFPLRLSPWKYLGISLIGVEANYFMMLALKYTTLTSVALFDAFAIPSAMTLSYFILGRRYRWLHLMGATICLFGMMVNVITDYKSDESRVSEIGKTRTDGSEHYPDKLLGDAFAIIGGILYGINDVFAERCVREWGGVHEYLGMMGLYGCTLSSIQALILERKAIQAFFHGGACEFKVSLLLLVTYVGCQVVRKEALSRFLLISEAAFLNLSMLTSDLYTTLFSIFAQNILPRNFYFVGLSLVLSGIFVYELAPSPVVPHVAADKLPPQTDELQVSGSSNPSIV